MQGDDPDLADVQRFSRLKQDRLGALFKDLFAQFLEAPVAESAFPGQVMIYLHDIEEGLQSGDVVVVGMRRRHVVDILQTLAP